VDASSSASETPTPLASSPSPVSADASVAGVLPSPVVAAEARRARVTRPADDPALRGVAEALAKQFAGPAPGGFDVQIAELTMGRRHAVLVSEAGKPTSDARPFVVVTDENGVALWTKNHPIGGILPPVAALAIAGGPRGRVALAACDPPTKSVALRLWDDDGSPFADFQVLDVEACDGLSVLYWPRRGWIVVGAATDATRARLVSESGSLGWGRGLDVGARSPADALAPASLAADTDDTFVLVQGVQPSKLPGSPFHALAFRYDVHGTAIWPAAVDLGQLPRAPMPGERLTVTRAQPAGVRVSIGADFDVIVRPSGDVSPSRPARP
jgi:hypothetical protein